VQKGKPAELELENPMDVLVITSASLGSKVGKERHVLCCEVDGSKFVICSLTLGVRCVGRDRAADMHFE
jgi:hypothetical protein